MLRSSASRCRSITRQSTSDHGASPRGGRAVGTRRAPSASVGARHMGTAEPATRPRLYLIDGSGYVYRAFHALPSLGTSRGLPTNAVYGFTNMVVKLLREERPRHLAVVFDLPGETFRDQLYADYKATRAPVPDELRPQMGYVRKVVEALRLPVVEVPGVEADDVIGTLARQASGAGPPGPRAPPAHDPADPLRQRATPLRAPAS